MLLVPAAKPESAPDVAFTVATVVVPDVHVPPAGVEESDDPEPGHTARLPLIVPIAFTVTVVVRPHPVGST